MDELLPTARDLMRGDYLAVRPSLGLLEAVGRLERYNEDTAFVVDEHGRLIGMLTEKRCLRALAARAYDESDAASVEDVMAALPPCLALSADAYAIAQTFWSCSWSVLPVADGGHIVGAVSQLAVLRALLGVISHRARARHVVEQTADDLRERPEAIERLQRVCSRLDRRQLMELFRRSH
jgi:CBS domain-containing protein